MNDGSQRLVCNKAIAAEQARLKIGILCRVEVVVLSWFLCLSIVFLLNEL